MNGTTPPPTLPAHSEVLIAGAGPTGLTLAVALTTYGVPCTIIDALPQGANSSRAAVVHARTLEVLDPLNIADPLISEGLRATRFTIRDRDRALMTIGFADLPTSYPYTLMVSQATTEAVLLRRLTDLGVPVHRPTRLTGLTQTEALVTATFADGATITADWVVGADGMHSTVREHTGIAFSGAAYPESFLLADVTPATWRPPGRGDPLLLPRRDARARATA